MATLAQYLAHARAYGGFGCIWTAAWSDDLGAMQLGELAVGLRTLTERRRQEGRKGSKSDGFKLSRTERVELVARLDDAGVADAEVARYLGVPKSRLASLRGDGSDATASSRN